MNDEIPSWAIDLIKQIERKIWVVAGAAGVISGAATIVWSMFNG